jgi:hypothetical protein
MFVTRRGHLFTVRRFSIIWHILCALISAKYLSAVTTIFKRFELGESMAASQQPWSQLGRRKPLVHQNGHLLTDRGQAVVEFTLVFVLLLIVAWIPADFGLAFYTGQLALNASREGARIAAADPNPTSDSCTLGGTCTSEPAGTPLRAAADRLSSALLPGATVTVTFPSNGAGTCNQMVSVGVTGTYNYFFYQLLHLFGVGGNLNTANINRLTEMRWEHQC